MQSRIAAKGIDFERNVLALLQPGALAPPCPQVEVSWWKPAQHDLLPLRHEAQRLEAAGARGVVLEEEAVDLGLEHRFGHRVVAPSAIHMLAWLPRQVCIVTARLLGRFFEMAFMTERTLRAAWPGLRRRGAPARGSTRRIGRRTRHRRSAGIRALLWRDRRSPRGRRRRNIHSELPSTSG